jgi:tetratricopeptide (TPR) repeat protein
MLGDENVATQQLSMTVTLLQRWARERPAFAQILSVELLNRAKLLSDAGRNDQAKILLSNALVIDPAAAKTEEHLFLYIRVMDPGDAKLTRCQLFLRDYPDSPRRLDVLMIIVRDAAAISKQFGRWNRNRAQLYLSAGLSAAKELISQNPKMSNLDLEVFELAKQHAESKQFNEAIDLTSELIAAVPDSAIKLQIEQAIAEWRVQSGKGTLPPEFDTLAARVEKELKIFSLTTPAAIRSLMTNPDAVHVVQVTDGCTVNKFNSEEDEILRRWVADGGILWANNDVLTRFGIKYTDGRWGMAGARECKPGAVPHPILTGCSRVVATKGSTVAINLSYINVITLLTSSYREEKYTYWSLVPYGNGWVSNVKTVDQTKFDGARFWLNFRLFCLGLDIPNAERLEVVPGIPTTPARITPPPAPIQLPNVRGPRPTRITDTANLTKSLADGAGQKIIWVALPRNDIDIETRKILRNWI